MISSQEQIDKIAAIVALLDDHLEPARGENRRRQPRLNLRMPLSVALLTSTGAMPVDAFLRNISLSGMGFVSRRMFRAEERIAVALDLPKLPSKQVLARVTFARYVRSGLYEMGAEFLKCVAIPAGESPGHSPLSRIPSHWLLSVGLQRPPANAPLPAAASSPHPTPEPPPAPPAPSPN